MTFSASVPCAEGAGLVTSKTKVFGESFINFDRGAVAIRRVNGLKRSVWASGGLHSIPVNGQRASVPWFVTLTYADPEGWKPNHIKDAINAFRRWCTRARVACKYTWVAEIQPGRARSTGKHVVHYHLMCWLPVNVRMPLWDRISNDANKVFWAEGMTNTQIAKAGIGYLMKYLSKLGEFTQFPKGLRLYGIGGLDATARSVRSWLNFPQWAKCSYGVGDIVRKSFGLMVRRTGEILQSPYVVQLVPGGLIVRAIAAIPEPFHSGPYSSYSTT